MDDVLTTSIHKASQERDNVLKAKAFVNQNQDEEIINLGDDFDFEGFQVVRREFFAHTKEPSVVFNNFKIYVNTSCLNRFPNTEFIQILMNQSTKIMAIRPSQESAKDSFQWYTLRKGKKMPKQISCKLFFAKVVKLMNWDPTYRYKMLGKVIQANGEVLIAFDLAATEVYPKTITEDNKVRASRVAVYPAEWENQFGVSYTEHQQSMQIDIFNGYAVYSVKENENMGNKPLLTDSVQKEGATNE